MRLFPQVITIQKGNPLATSFLYTPVPRSRNALVVLMDQPNPVIFDGFDHRSTVVGGTVVDNDNLEILAGFLIKAPTGWCFRC